MIIDAANEYIKSIATHGLDTAIRARAKFPIYKDWLQLGYNSTTGASTTNQAGFFVYGTGTTVKAISSKAGANTITVLGDKGTDYLILEVFRKSDENKYLVDGGDGATHITNIVLTALSILIEDSAGVGQINVDWIFVKKYASPDPTWGTWGAEETPTPPSGVSFVAWIN
jgi:hypothetical protein